MKKRVISFVPVVLCLLLAFVLLSAAAADTNPPKKLGAPSWEAEEDVMDVFNVNKQMQIGENEFEIGAGKRKNLGFTPTESGLYAIYSIGNYDTYGMLRDPNLNVYDENDDWSDENYNFHIVYGLTANTPYIVGVQFFSQTMSGTVTVVIEKLNQCGDGLYWQYNTETNTLSILGSGPMWNYERGYTPWADFDYAIDRVFLPDEITSVSQFAFAGCEHLTYINIPQCLTSIGRGAFMGCKCLEPEGISIDSSNTAFSVRDGVLYGRNEGSYLHTYLYANPRTAFVVPGNLDAVADYAFAGCENLTAVAYGGDGYFEIGEGTFLDCFSLEFADLSQADHIWERAFMGCDHLERIVIDTCLTKVEALAFYECNALTDVYYLGTEAQRNANLTIDSFGNEKLLNATWHYEAENELESFMCGDLLFWSFDDSTGALTITGAGDMWPMYSGKPWWMHTNDITSVSLPEGITTIAPFAFAYCDNLASVNIPANITYIGEGAFMGCMSLTPEGISIDPGCTRYYMQDGVLYFHNEGWGIHTYLASNPEKTYKITGNMDAIAEYAFANCDNLEAVTIEDTGLYEISRGMFQDCLSLEYAGLYNVDRIDQYAFYECISLRRIVITTDLHTVENNAFVSCDALTDVYYLGTEAERNANLTINSTGNDALLDATWHYVDDVSTFMCGDYLFWYYNSEMHTLAIEGSGDMWDFEWKAAPWFDAYADDVLAVALDRNVTRIGNYAFMNCTKVVACPLPQGLQSIGENAFENNHTMTTIEIPASVRAIEDNALKGCDALETVTLHEGLETIGREAFRGCWVLNAFHIPASVTSIGVGNFRECYALTPENFTIEPGNTSYRIEDGVLFTYDYDILHTYLYNNTRTEYTVPENVSEIADFAFEENNALVTVRLPRFLFIIGECAFDDCENLATADLPSNMTMIGESAFSGTAIRIVRIPKNVTRIEPWTFSYCSSLTTVEIPKTVTDIGEGAFYQYQNALTDVYYTGTQAERNTNLTIDNTSNNNDPLLNATWHYETSLTSFMCGDDLYWEYDSRNRWLGIHGTGDMWDFPYFGATPWENYRTSVRSILIANSSAGSNVTSIGDFAFAGFTGVTSFSMPNSIRRIGLCALYDCTALKNVTLSNNLTEIGTSAFLNCSALETITLPGTLEHIGAYAFGHCSTIPSVTIPAGVTSIEETAFTGMDSVPAFTVAEGNTAYCAVDGVLFTIDGKTLMQYPGGNTATSYEIPDGVERVAEEGFAFNAHLVTVGIPNTAQDLGYGAFACCSGLQYITLPSGLDGVSAELFTNCTGLEKITLPGTITITGDAAFYNCTALSDVYFFGTEAQRNAIDFCVQNECLENATWHYITVAFKTQTLLLDGEIGVKFYMDLPEIDGVDYEDSYMTFAITGIGTTTERDDFDPNDKNPSGKYYAFTCYVNSVQMADTITATFHFGEGLTIEKTYSVKQYFLDYNEAIAANPNLFNAKTKKLIRAVADYGHYMQPFLAAQNDWTIGTDHAEMDVFYTQTYDFDAIASAAAGSAISYEGNGAKIGRVRFTLEMNSTTTIRVLLKPSSGYTGPFTVTVDGGEPYTPEMTGGWYHVDIGNVGAHQLSALHTAVVTTEGGTATITFSALSYVNMMIGSTDSVMQNAVAAIWAYSDAADAFNGK